MCNFALISGINMGGQNIITESKIISRNGSTENGTVCNGEFLAAIINMLYLCTAFETKVQDIEY